MDDPKDMDMLRQILNEYPSSKTLKITEINFCVNQHIFTSWVWKKKHKKVQLKYILINYLQILFKNRIFTKITFS